MSSTSQLRASGPEHARARPRLLGVMPTDDKGRWSPFFDALAERCDLVGVVRPVPSRAERYLNLLRTFHPDKSRWRARAGFDGGLASLRTRRLTRAFADRRGSYDLIIQLQTLCAPALAGAETPYAIYTDNTMALTQRMYPAWIPLSDRHAAAWMRYEAEICRSAAVIFTMSEFARQSVIGDYGCAPESVVSVGAGANLTRGSLDERDPVKTRALFVGIDFARKGGHVLLDAWPSVRARVPDAELVVVGPSRTPDGELPAGVAWLGPADRARLSELYSSASVFVLPSLFEPWGLVFHEAMAHGLPCIGAACCAMPEIIDDGVTGRLVAPGEPEPLADAIVELLSDHVLAATMGRTGFMRVHAADRWSDVADRVATHLESALQGQANLGLEE